MTDTNCVVYQNVIDGISWHVEVGTTSKNIFGGVPTYHLYRNWDLVKTPSQFSEAQSVDDPVITSVAELYFLFEAHFKQFNAIGLMIELEKAKEQLIEINKAKDRLYVLERDFRSGAYNHEKYEYLISEAIKHNCDLTDAMRAEIENARKHLAELEKQSGNSQGPLA